MHSDDSHMLPAITIPIIRPQNPDSNSYPPSITINIRLSPHFRDHSIGQRVIKHRIHKTRSNSQSHPQCWYMMNSIIFGFLPWLRMMFMSSEVSITVWGCSWLETPIRGRLTDAPATDWAAGGRWVFLFCLVFGCQTSMKEHEMGKLPLG